VEDLREDFFENLSKMEDLRGKIPGTYFPTLLVNKYVGL